MLSSTSPRITRFYCPAALGPTLPMPRGAEQIVCSLQPGLAARGGHTKGQPTLSQHLPPNSSGQWGGVRKGGGKQEFAALPRSDCGLCHCPDRSMSEGGKAQASTHAGTLCIISPRSSRCPVCVPRPKLPSHSKGLQRRRKAGLACRLHQRPPHFILKGPKVQCPGS